MIKITPRGLSKRVSFHHILALVSAAVYAAAFCHTFLTGHSASPLPDFLFINNLLHHSVPGKSHGHFSFVMQHPPNPLTSHRSAYAIFPLPPPQSWCCLLTLAVKDVFVTTECRKIVGNFGTVRDFYKFICSWMQELNTKILLQKRLES